MTADTVEQSDLTADHPAPETPGAFAAISLNSEGNGTTDVKRREQILEAARSALVKVGFEKITTRRIAEEAGVNIATLHYYFGTKEALLIEAVRYAARRTEKRVRAAIEKARSAREALIAAFEAIWQLVRERPGVLRYDVVVRGLRDPSARQEAMEIYAVYRGLMDEIMRRHLAEGGRLALGITPEHFSYYVIAVMDGIILQHTLTGDDEAARLSFDLMKRHALALMGIRETASAVGEEDTVETHEPE